MSASHHPLEVTRQFAGDLNASVADYRDRVSPHGIGARAPNAGAEAVAVCLLGALENGESVEAERLRYEDSLDVWDVQVIGFPGELAQTFRLQLNGELSEPIRLDATNQEIAEILRNSGDIWSQHLTSVSVGSHGSHTLMRWRLGFTKSAEGEELELVTQGGSNVWEQLGSPAAILIQKTQYIGTGDIIPVHAPIPFGEPSPARPGAIGIAVPVARGWGLVSLEPRKFTALDKISED